MSAGWTTKDKTRRWEHHREIKNLMGKYMLSLLLNKEKDMYEMFWSKTARDVCLGFNNGWYSGEKAIRAYYEAVHQSVVKTAKLMQQLYPAQLGDKSDDEIFGAGPYTSRPVSNVVIEIAEDEKTAKGMWYSRGSSVRVTISGTISYWSWGVYAVDFVYEDEAWKLWHMRYLEDVNIPCGQSWGKPEQPYPAAPGYETADSLYAEIPRPNVPTVLREYYHPNRPFTPLPAYPEPYGSFADTFSYGIGKEDGQ